MSRGDEQAFPKGPQDFRDESLSGRVGYFYKGVGGTAGMTIRERFVMAAMQGLCANPEVAKYRFSDSDPTSQKILASASILVADAALAALEKE